MIYTNLYKSTNIKNNKQSPDIPAISFLNLGKALYNKQKLYNSDISLKDEELSSSIISLKDGNLSSSIHILNDYIKEETIPNFVVKINNNLGNSGTLYNKFRKSNSTGSLLILTDLKPIDTVELKNDRILRGLDMLLTIYDLYESDDEYSDYIE